MKTNRCIEPNMLTRYIMGDLPAELIAPVEDHLADCEECYEEFVNTSSLIRDEALLGEETAFPALKAIWKHLNLKPIYNWIRESLPPNAQLQPALAMRGADTAMSHPDEHIEFHKGFERLKVECRIDKGESYTFALTINLLHEYKAATQCRVILIKDGFDKDSRPVIGDSLTFEEMPFGTYQCLVRLDGVKKGEFSFKINEAGLHEI